MNGDGRGAIRDLIANWAAWRDRPDWERLRSCWHVDGWMVATWWEGPAEEFVQLSREGFERGVRVTHSLGGTSVDLTSTRAVAVTRMAIGQRALLAGVAVDVTCTGRFFDLLERRDHRWGIVLRHPIYDHDRLDPVDPGRIVSLDTERLESFPEGYRHLAYLQTDLGYRVRRDLPGISGPVTTRLYQAGERWLDGQPITPDAI